MLNYYRTLTFRQLVITMLVGIFLLGGDVFAQKNRDAETVKKKRKKKNKTALVEKKAIL